MWAFGVCKVCCSTGGMGLQDPASRSTVRRHGQPSQASRRRLGPAKLRQGQARPGGGPASPSCCGAKARADFARPRQLHSQQRRPRTEHWQQPHTEVDMASHSWFDGCAAFVLAAATIATAAAAAARPQWWQQIWPRLHIDGLPDPALSLQSAFCVFPAFKLLLRSCLRLLPDSHFLPFHACQAKYFNV